MVSEQHNKRSLIFIFVYLLEWLSGVIIYFTYGKEDEALKKHSTQAIVLGIISIILSILFGSLGTIINIVIWIYGMYLGFDAYFGKDNRVPFISNYIWQTENTSSTSIKHTKRATTVKEPEENDEALTTLKLRYANGKITRKKYLEMKKELEQ